MTEDRSLDHIIRSEIRQSGPMPVWQYMTLALGHRRHGYYTSGDPLGARGDFTTAPEISQMFGELLGFFIVNLWQQAGEPKSFTLLELGPGRGTLMADMLRVAGRAEGFHDALHLHLYESNPDLRAQQAARLGKYNPYWNESITEFSDDDPLFVVANEFFDALPINQYVRMDDGWHERQIGIGPDDTLTWGLSPTPIPVETMPTEVRAAETGEVFEDNRQSALIVAQLSKRIANQGGALLAVDYGYAESQTGETLQAVRKHGFADPLIDPGTADLSAHVDFGALRKAAIAGGLTAAPLATQRDFLGNLGIVERASALARANPDQLDTIAAALKRLTDPDEMGTLFKVFCAHPDSLQPIGFS